MLFLGCSSSLCLVSSSSRPRLCCYFCADAFTCMDQAPCCTLSGPPAVLPSILRQFGREHLCAITAWSFSSARLSAP